MPKGDGGIKRSIIPFSMGVMDLVLFFCSALVSHRQNHPRDALSSTILRHCRSHGAASDRHVYRHNGRAYYWFCLLARRKTGRIVPPENLPTHDGIRTSTLLTSPSADHYPPAQLCLIFCKWTPWPSCSPVPTSSPLAVYAAGAQKTDNVSVKR